MKNGEWSRLATTLIAAMTIAGCQSSMNTRGGLMEGEMPDTGEVRQAQTVDISQIEGKWTGRGKRDGARRTLEVMTDANGQPMFRYCYLSHCRKSTGHTLTHKMITPTKIEFRWNAGPLFRFQLEGDVLQGARGNPARPVNIFPMTRTGGT